MRGWLEYFDNLGLGQAALFPGDTHFCPVAGHTMENHDDLAVFPPGHS